MHCVGIDAQSRVVFAEIFDSKQIRELTNTLAGPAIAAIDAPECLSTAPHDDDPSLSRKFSVARCAEIGLGREHRIWVPWVTPSTEPVPGWMEVGFEIFRDFQTNGIATIEVYPYAGFRRLARGAALPKKTSAAGVRARIEAIGRAGVNEVTLPMWSHDGLDALLAAVVARDWSTGAAVAATCGHDGSAIWLPAEPCASAASVH